MGWVTTISGPCHGNRTHQSCFVEATQERLVSELIFLADSIDREGDHPCLRHRVTAAPVPAGPVWRCSLAGGGRTAHLTAKGGTPVGRPRPLRRPQPASVHHTERWLGVPEVLADWNGMKAPQKQRERE